MEWERTAGLVFSVLLAEFTRTFFIDLSAYPRWLVIFVGTLLAVVAIWILLKVLKVTLWILLIVVLVGGFFWAGAELLQ